MQNKNQTLKNELIPVKNDIQKKKKNILREDE